MALCRLANQTDSVVGDPEPQGRPVPPDPHRHLGARTGVLPRVLQRLQTAEVRRRLDLLRVPTGQIDHDGAGQRRTRGRRPERLAQSTIAQQRRVDTVGQFAQFADRGLDVAAELLEQLQHQLGVLLGDLPGQAELHRERHQMLLGAVVQVAFDRPARIIRRRDHPQPGRLQLGVALSQFVERFLQRGVQPDVVQGQAELPGQVHQQPLVVRAERLIVAAPPDDHRGVRGPAAATTPRTN
jgi:hypothetical protein